MTKKKNIQRNKPLSLMPQKRWQSVHLMRKLKEEEDRYRDLQGECGQLYKDLSEIEKSLKESEEKYQKLYAENEKAKDKLSRIGSNEIVEKFLKNEVYAFLLTDGLLDKFLMFREPNQRTKVQDIIYNFVIALDLEGEWIDL